MVPNVTGFYLVLPSFTEEIGLCFSVRRRYRVLLGFTGFYWVSCNRIFFHLISEVFFRVPTGSRFFLPIFTDFYLVLLKKPDYF